jgi:membrane fusion protein
MANSSWDSLVRGSIVPLRTSWIIKSILCVVLALVTWQLTLVSLYTYARKITAPGLIWGTSSSTVVSSASGGNIEKVFVVAGQVVKSGQTLLDIRGSDSLLASYSTKQSELTSQLNALNNAQMDLKRRQLQLTQETKVAMTSAEIQKKTLAVALTSKTQKLSMIAERYDRLKLNASDFSRAEIDSVRSELLLEQENIARTKNEIQVLTQQSQSAKDNEAQQQAQIAQQMTDLSVRKLQLQAEINQLGNSKSNSIAAPHDGVITNVNITQGQTIDVGQPLVNIARDTDVKPKSINTARVFLSGSQIAVIRPGTEVWVEVKSFPVNEFGIFTGKVVSITHSNSKRDEDNLAGRPFVAEIVLNEKPITVFGRPAYLQHGMSITADIISQRLTLFEWLFEPVLVSTKKQPI